MTDGKHRSVIIEADAPREPAVRMRCLNPMVRSALLPILDKIRAGIHTEKTAVRMMY